MIQQAYDYNHNQQGDAHFYIAQYKTSRMKEWRYIFSSGSYADVQKALKSSQDRTEVLKATGEKYYTSRKHNYRVLKVDIELLPV